MTQKDQILKLFSGDGVLTSYDIAEELNIPQSSVRRNLLTLRKDGLIEVIGLTTVEIQMHMIKMYSLKGD